MATLNEEIEGDLFSGELDDLFEDVSWGDYPVKAMVSVVGVEESLDEFGGATLSAVKEFKFRRKELVALHTDLSMFSDEIEYNGRTYDVNEVHERPGHPVIAVRATLRN